MRYARMALNIVFTLLPLLPKKQNVADMPTQKDWLTYAKWGKKYGQLIKILLYILYIHVYIKKQVDSFLSR